METATNDISVPSCHSDKADSYQSVEQTTVLKCNAASSCDSPDQEDINDAERSSKAVKRNIEIEQHENGMNKKNKMSIDRDTEMQNETSVDCEKINNNNSVELINNTKDSENNAKVDVVHKSIVQDTNTDVQVIDKLVEKPKLLESDTESKEPAKRNRKKRPLSCCVLNCKNNKQNSPGLKFYCFPSNNPLFPAKVQRRETWLRAVKLAYADGSPWVPDKKSRICSAHFVNNEKSEDPRGPSYNPTIFPDIYKRKKINPEAAVARYKRRLKRMQQNAISSSRLNLSKNKSRGDVDNMSESDIANLDFEPSHFEPEVQLLVDDTQVQLEPTNEKATQVNLIVKVPDPDEETQNTFFCTRYITSTVCHAELQVEISNLDAIERMKKNEAAKNNNQTCGVEMNKKVPVQENNEAQIIGFHGYRNIKSENEMMDMAGVTLKGFQQLLKILSVNEKLSIDCRVKTSNENKLLIFLMKMKCGLPFSVISVLFNLHRVTVTKIFHSVLDAVYTSCKDFVFLPQKKLVKETMPSVFKAKYGACRMILDYAEFAVEKPQKVEQRHQFFSKRQNGFRIKTIIGYTACGFICFLSKCYEGGTPDIQNTESSGILDLLRPGDLVITKEEFSDLKSVFDKKKVSQVLLPFHSYTEEDADTTREVAKVRFHIERMTQKIKNYKITDKFSTFLEPYSDKVLTVCCILINMQHSNFSPD